MAGILASSPSKVMTTGDTAVDQSVSGFITGERIVLGTNPTGASYSWGLSAPTASASARSKLDDAANTAPTFVPDAAGIYVVTVTVDGTSYVLRVAVLNVATVRFGEVALFLPIDDSQVPTPSIGHAVYLSKNQNAMVEKRPDGTIHTLTTS